ncbi:MAG: hypothetical protein PHX45_12890 [Acidobacteriota bacterium]|nr:hypothetical protein [Acidobacteriota bacterium]
MPSNKHEKGLDTRRFPRPACILGAFLVFSAFITAAESNPTQCLPGKADLSGWSPAGEPEVYRGEDLFRYMNGGAEVYSEYGFREVAVQEYENPSGKRIALEIFEMSSPESAFGMYSFKTTGEGRAVDLGCDSEIEDYYLNFWKGRFLVTLAGFDDEEATRGGLAVIGGAVHSKIREDCGRPSLINLFPVEGVKRTGIKYFRGALGVKSIYAFFPDAVLKMKEGLKADYEDGCRLFIFQFADIGKSREAFIALRTEAHAEPAAGERGSEAGEFLRREDGRGQSVLFRLSGRLVLAGMGTDEIRLKSFMQGIRP